MKKGGKRVGAGRPKGGIAELTRELRAIITDGDVKLALGVLRRNMRQTKNANAAQAAAAYLLDQKYGKARQTVDLGNKDEKPLRVIMD